MYDIKKIINALGGVSQVSARLNRHRTTIYNWIKYDKITVPLIQLAWDEGLEVRDFLHDRFRSS
tara:strand:- start:322 stop:513 length:192 start_codon:yes stop_codon:yes gene_type:complete